MRTPDNVNPREYDYFRRIVHALLNMPRKVNIGKLWNKDEKVYGNGYFMLRLKFQLEL